MILYAHSKKTCSGFHIRKSSFEYAFFVHVKFFGFTHAESGTYPKFRFFSKVFVVQLGKGVADT